MHAQLIVDAAMKAAAQGKYDPPTWTIPEAPSAANDPAAADPNAPADPAAAPPAAPATTTQSSCSASPRSSGAGTGSMAALAGLAIAAALGARRRRTS
jgi:MYXO-CTERM domain-containing protein